MNEAATTVESRAQAAATPRVRADRRPVHRFTPRTASLTAALRELWRLRRFVLYFGHRFVAKRYSRTWLGILWLPLRPAVTLVTRILIYGGLVGIASGRIPYSLSFLLATTAWQLFAECAYWSIRSMELNRKLLATVYIPRTLLVASAVVPSVVDFLVNLFFLVAALVYYLIRAHFFYVEVGVQNLLAVAGFACMILLGLGFGLLFAGASARTRDVRFSLPFILNFLYFVTPIIYPLSQIPPQYRPLAELNPMTGAVEMARDGLFATETLSGNAALVTVIAILLMWGPGLWLANRREVAVLNGARGRLRVSRAARSAA